jgi:predicted enzyme related to lactoylglutathione lyase
MQILQVFIPVITDNHAHTVAFYQNLFRKNPKVDFEAEGMHVSVVDTLVILSGTDPGALAFPAQVNAIFSVDDLDAFWDYLNDLQIEILFQRSQVPSGRNFYVRHPDGKIIEYLQLNK